MINDKMILAIIPARGGSKGLPGKNIKPLLGKPLIGWTIEQAKESKYIDEIYVSTDSQEIADVAITFGIDVPHLRPSELASDTATSASFVIYTINLYKNKGVNFDYLLLLEPTSPLRNIYDIDNAIELAINNSDKTGVVSLGEVHMEHPSIVKTIDQEGRIVPYFEEKSKITQRQQLHKALFPYGVIYLVKIEEFLKDNLFYGINSLPYYIERWQCYEVDDIYDFVAIESIMKMRNSQ
jgi:CMP-N,N'-diacetyllegionaminic acid synthase